MINKTIKKNTANPQDSNSIPVIDESSLKLSEFGIEATPAPAQPQTTPPIIPDELIKKAKMSNKFDIIELLNNVTPTTQPNGDVIYSVYGRDSFIDKGDKMNFLSSKPIEDEDILAMVLLAKEKYNGHFSLTGNDEFKERAMKLIIANNIDISFTNPKQASLFDKIKAENDTEKATATATEKVDVTKKINQPEPISIDTSSTEKVNPNNLIGVSKLAHWTSLKDENESLPEDRRFEIGRKPDSADFYWFNQQGEPQNLGQKDIAGFEEYLMKDFNESLNKPNDGEKTAILSEFKENNGEKENTVSLYNDGKSKYMSGFITGSDGVRHNVIIFPNERKNSDKPNFLTINELVIDPENKESKYKIIGYGNAINSKKGSTENVYFDEVLFNLQNVEKPEVIKATVSKNISPEYHALIGFTEQLKDRNNQRDPEKNNAADLKEVAPNNEAPTDNTHKKSQKYKNK